MTCSTEPASATPDEYNVWQAGIAVGHVVFYVFGHSSEEEVAPGIDALTRISPAGPRLVWPTQPTLEMRVLEKMFRIREVPVLSARAG